MDPDLEPIWRNTSAQTGMTIAVYQGREAMGLAADDRDHQRQAEPAGASEGTGCAADTEPNRKRVLERARVDSLPGECRAMLARPVNVRVLADVQKQIELSGEERIVVIKLQAIERERFDERAAPRDDPCPPLREQIERCEFL